jgi:hypothetical protein
MLKRRIILRKIALKIPTLEHHYPLSNGRAGLCDLEADHGGDRWMTAENQLDLLFDDHHCKCPNGIPNSDDIGRVKVRSFAWSAEASPRWG